MKRADTLVPMVRTLVVILALGVAVFFWQRHSNEVIRQGQLIGCERGKQDRADAAAAWTAHRRYLGKVLQAGSVKGDVKRAARDALRTYDRIVASLDSRTGRHLDCQKVYPRP